ncbi:uncharacterized protein DSM5745_08934 [Aspergillus mulundensis]|uniref:DNA endonuclease activator Ctp1 C-terminal domain-containing protein n=1 Tax=Aspergillus mulundensis TaxID=1810919 RepID=A0A3D8R5T7_9EURO|nr:Uncharacterized protein DSM5745_08934 [Aspergillus mulundensis]RDW69174.1 Uncharacterized protein DSM5745_08934 [Aspergillus mulundensis]
METLHKLQLSLTQDFKNHFDTAYSDINAEIAAYNARVKNAEERAKIAEEARQRAADELDMLRHEVFLLREELRQDEVNSKEAENAAESALRLDETYEPGRVLGNKELSAIETADLRRISDRYIELYGQAAVIVQASGNLKDLVKRHKNKVTRLKALLQRPGPSSAPDAEAIKHQRLSTRPTTSPVPLGSPCSMANPLKDPARDKANVSSGEPALPTTEVVPEQDSNITRNEHRISNHRRLQGNGPDLSSTSSDASTEGLPPINGATTNAQLEQLKLKRTAAGQTKSKDNWTLEISGKGGPAHPIMVKSETLSSSPLMAPSPQPVPPGTQDLDDVGDTVVTPTKRIRFYRDQAYSATPKHPQNSLRLASGRHAPHLNCASKGNNRVLSVLRPVDGNLRSSSTGQMADKKRKKALGATRISSITEDGDENRPLSWIRGTKPPQGDYARDLSREHRLSDLLETTSPASRALQSKVATNVSAATPSRGLHSSVRGSSMTTGSETGATSVTKLATSNSSQGSPKPTMRESYCDKLQHRSERLSQLEAMPDDEPYRARPPQRLGLEHFRINPEYNNGLDYAYDTVIRKRDERKCASGCTRPGCCGEKFSAMARFGIPVDASGKAMSDREILEEFLGEDKNAIDILSSECRDGLLVEAKARVFANQFGKHRHQHHKPGTPPGFWRTGMPGTQEIEEDREDARRLEREKVQERYREALRPNGLWRFADE